MAGAATQARLSPRRAYSPQRGEQPPDVAEPLYAPLLSPISRAVKQALVGLSGVDDVARRRRRRAGIPQPNWIAVDKERRLRSRARAERILARGLADGVGGLDAGVQLNDYSHPRYNSSMRRVARGGPSLQRWHERQRKAVNFDSSLSGRYSFGFQKIERGKMIM